MREFLEMLLPIAAAFVVLYLVVDLFDRLDVLLKNHATSGAAARYFLFKVPLMVTRGDGPFQRRESKCAYSAITRPRLSHIAVRMI
jgi:hypothetical protein